MIYDGYVKYEEAEIRRSAIIIAKALSSCKIVSKIEITRVTDEIRNKR